MIQYEPWKITWKGTGEPRFLESIFSQGNGYLGSRGAFFIDGAKAYERCTYLAGGFEYISPGITDMVNLPDLFYFQLRLEGEAPERGKGEYVSFSQSLDLRNGLFQRESVWKDLEGRQTAVNISRFISMDNKHISGLTLELTALNYSGKAEVLIGLDGGTINLPVNDDQTQENLDTVSLLSVKETRVSGEYCFLRAESSASGRLKIAMTGRVRVDEGETGYGRLGLDGKTDCSNPGFDGGSESFNTPEDASTPGCPAQKLKISLIPRKTVRIEKLIYTESASQEGSALQPRILDGSFHQLLKDSEKAWKRRWKDGDIQVETEGGDLSTQTALRYHLFQLMQNCPYDDPTVSIGARGLTHGRYKGCYFWDTDIFMLPFYLYTDPPAARNLILFRLSTLSDARENAKALNLPGARYPWMCVAGGKEQCQSWDIGRCEIHITADVAFAVENYLNISGDKTLGGKPAELYVETARYWAGRFTYDKRQDRYNLLFVKGPDEYCGVSANNAYTVLLARHNLSLALQAVEKEEAFADRSEVEKWKQIIEKSQIEYDPERDLFIQDDNFLRLEPFPEQKNLDGRAAYHKYAFDWLQRYQVLKQADLVLLMVLMPDLFSKNQRRAIWDFYEPLTLHDSTLSWGIHVWAAAVLGLEEKAQEYFYKSLFLDLKDLMKNTGREGIHLAGMGATWQAVIFGFAGLSADGEGKPALSPRLPKDWKSLRFHFYRNQKRYGAVIDGNGWKVEED